VIGVTRFAFRTTTHATP